MDKLGPHMTATERINSILEMAADVPYDDTWKLSFTGPEILRTACDFEEDGEVDVAFFFFSRYVNICTSGIYVASSDEEQRLIAYADVLQEKVDDMKNALMTRYEHEHKKYVENLKTLEKQEEDQPEDSASPKLEVEQQQDEKQGEDTASEEAKTDAVSSQQFEFNCSVQ